MRNPPLRPRFRRRSAVVLGTLVVVAVGAGLALAQEFRGGTRGQYRRFPSPDQAAVPGFMFCRVAYTQVRREANGQGWTTDYPNADANFPLRLSQLTVTPISLRADGEPFHAVVEVSNDLLYRCPFIFMSDVGTAGFTDLEIDRLRDYLDKGGFLWVDDFWGEFAWQNWAENVRRLYPERPIVDIPSNHELMHSLYDVLEVPQIPSIQSWRRSGGRTSERGYESATANFRGVLDDRGRAVIIMSHNTDIADGWEREGEDAQFFSLFSPDAYAFGINVVLYAMSH